MAQRLDGISLGCIAVGGFLTYAGIAGKSIPSMIQAAITGKAPSSAAKANQITGTPASAADTAGTFGTGTSPGAPGATGATGTGTGAAIANQALTYVGKLGYCFGGAMTGSSNGCPVGQPDCSSFVNWVVGHDMGMAIPGYAAGTYTGSVHGPATASWALFGNSISSSQVQAGDIVVWGPGHHMGIATSNTDYVSDHDAATGVSVTSIAGSGVLGILFCRRIVG